MIIEVVLRRRWGFRHLLVRTREDRFTAEVGVAGVTQGGAFQEALEEMGNSFGHRGDMHIVGSPLLEADAGAPRGLSQEFPIHKVGSKECGGLSANLLAA